MKLTSALLVTMLLMAIVICPSLAWIVNDGCREQYNVCRPNANGSPGGISAHGAPNCHLQTNNLHEGKACPQLPNRICINGRCVQPQTD